MVFEFLRWKSGFKEYKRGDKKGNLLFKRPHPYFDLSSKGGWFHFFVLAFGCIVVASACGITAYLLVSSAVGGSVFTPMTWIWIFVIGWLCYWFAHLIHSLRFVNNAKLTDVEFVPFKRPGSIDRRLMRISDGALTIMEYEILFSRCFWADVRGEPYRDVTDWFKQMESVRTGGGVFLIGTEDSTAGSTSESIGFTIGAKYSEHELKKLSDMAGGIPEPRDIVEVVQTELVPEHRRLLGDRLMMLYLIFLVTQPPILPYDRTTSRSEMRAVANASDTQEVLDYLNGFAKKVREV